MKEETTLYVDVALGIPQIEPYQYRVPEHLRSSVAIGKRAHVPLRAQSRYGYIVALGGESKVEDPRPISDVVDQVPLLGEQGLKLTRWMSRYYFCSWGQAIETTLPAPFKRGRTTMKSRQTNGPPREFVHAGPAKHVLTPAQRRAYEAVSRALDEGRFAHFLLHGVTGSGKTEIYLHLIEKLLGENRGAIMLVPEISLTPQTTDRFESRFGDKVSVVHSRVPQGKRLEEWHRIRRGEAKVVVGARSALFSPVQSLGLIVIDEEQEGSYKQEETPRYEAGRVALKRCEIENAVLLKGTATPSLESYTEALEGRAALLTLPSRIGEKPLPEVEIIDMRREFGGRLARIFSERLERAVREAIDRGEQVMLFLNRRGFAPYVSCLVCGYVADCKRCRVSLVFHYDRQALLCHTCNHAVQPPQMCPVCQKGYLKYLGMGTEKVESEAHRLFPHARIERMDTDATRKKASHEKILRAFRKREVDILLGTQMIAKGHDFPGVSVIGVISADTSLHLPDFRSAEKTFDLLTQVAGRAGREDVPGKVFVQTYVPTHYAIQAAKGHDYEGFYKKEMAFRKELGLPPFTRIVQLVFSARPEKKAIRKAAEFKRHLAEDPEGRRYSVLGAAPCMISKRRGLFRWQLLIKTHDPIKTNETLQRLLKTFDRRGTHLTIDVDPR